MIVDKKPPGHSQLVITIKAGEKTVYRGDANMKSTLGDYMDLERLLKRVYAPAEIDLQYSWRRVQSKAGPARD